MKKFYIVPTPVGNLADMTYRAVEILKEVDVVLCEDTRTSRVLFDHYDISAKTISYNSHASESKEEAIIHAIENEGLVYALVSDAGTPTISDPGSRIISKLYAYFDNDIDIISLPGATALIPALSASGFSGNQFSFLGFIPHKKGRNSYFDKLNTKEEIIVMYESPHRLLKTLQSLYERMPERRIFIAREISKKFEEKLRMTCTEAYDFFSNNEQKIRGEFVLVLDKK